MKKTHANTTLKKIIFLIECLSSAELLSRTLMELWMSGYEAERIPIDQIMTYVSEKTTLPEIPDRTTIPNSPSLSDCIHGVSNSSLSDNSPNTSGLSTPDNAAITPNADKHLLSQTHLIVTDRADLAKCCLQHGLAVIGYLHEQNKDMSFDGIHYLIEDISGLDAPFCELVFCRAHQLPYTVFETARCLVREITTEDVPRLYEIYSDPSITHYIEALYADEVAERSYIRDYIDHVYPFYDYGMWIVVNKENGQVIGRAGIEPKEDFAELGYVIAREYQNQGYATEVCRAVLTYAADRLSLPEIYVRVQKENAASLRICEKLKFQPVPRTEDSDMMLFTLRLN